MAIVFPSSISSPVNGFHIVVLKLKMISMAKRESIKWLIKDIDVPSNLVGAKAMSTGRRKQLNSESTIMKMSQNVRTF